MLYRKFGCGGKYKLKQITAEVKAAFQKRMWYGLLDWPPGGQESQSGGVAEAG